MVSKSAVSSVSTSISTWAKDYFGNPSLLFAVSAALFWGHEGGTKLTASLLVLTAIVLCITMRQTSLKQNIIGALLARPATAQVLVGLLGIFTAGLIFSEKAVDTFSGREWLFLGCASLNLASNILMARGLEKGFDNGDLSLKSVLLSPQVWGIVGCVAGAVYNNVYTVFGLPLMFAGVIVSVRGSLSLGRVKLEGVGMPYYLNIAYNAWFAGCNMIGEHPNTLVVASCFVGGVACYSMGVHAEKLARSGARIPADQLVFIEIPGVVYRAPRMTDDFAYTWSPVSFEAAR